ncbi:MAG: alpha/beta hydrolase [Pseudomonadota bacterium]
MWQEHLRDRQLGLISFGGAFDPARPGLLCVHGSGGRGDEFSLLLEALGEAANSAALDLPGHGATPGPGRQSVADYAAWVADFLAAGPVRPWLLGHSLGGAIALTVALERPELLGGLVLWGTGARLKVLPAILEGLAQHFLPTVELLVDLAYAPATDPAIKDLGRRAMAASEPQVLWGDYFSCDHFDVMAGLGSITLPTLVVCGQEDRLTPPKYSQFLAGRIPGARLAVIPRAGHMLHQEEPLAAAQALAGFLAGRG